MDESKALSTQQQRLRVEWPRTAATLESTYFTSPTWGLTRSGTQNDAGYILWALARFESAAAALLPAARFRREELDLAAGREVTYHFTRGRQFRSVPAALASCWYNLITERPIRLDQARQALAGPRGAARQPMQLFSTVRSTVTPSSSSTRTPEFSGRYPSASALPEWTPPSSTPGLSPEP